MTQPVPSGFTDDLVPYALGHGPSTGMLQGTGDLLLLLTGLAVVAAALTLLVAPSPRNVRSLRGNLAFWAALGLALVGAAATAGVHGSLQQAEVRAAVRAREPGAQRYRQLLSDQAYLQTGVARE